MTLVLVRMVLLILGCMKQRIIFIIFAKVVTASIRISMDKRQQKAFEKLLETYAKVNKTTVEDIKETAGFDSLYSHEESVYEAQAVYNFFTARIQPLLEKGEKPEDFDKRYREWRIKKCQNCNEEFAYAYTYDGVAFCSLNCLQEQLQTIGVKFTVNRDLKKRWGNFHPAVVSSSALGTLKDLYQTVAADAFENVDPSRPNNHVQTDPQSSTLV